MDQDAIITEVSEHMRILVCDDDKEIVDAIEIYLVNEGYEVLKAYDGAQVKHAEEQGDTLNHHGYHDVRNGRHPRANNEAVGKRNIPVIMLSESRKTNDKILGPNPVWTIT